MDDVEILVVDEEKTAKVRLNSTAQSHHQLLQSLQSHNSIERLELVGSGDVEDVNELGLAEMQIVCDVVENTDCCSVVFTNIRFQVQSLHLFAAFLRKDDGENSISLLQFNHCILVNAPSFELNMFNGFLCGARRLVFRGSPFSFSFNPPTSPNGFFVQPQEEGQTNTHNSTPHCKSTTISSSATATTTTTTTTPLSAAEEHVARVTTGLEAYTAGLTVVDVKRDILDSDGMSDEEVMQSPMFQFGQMLSQSISNLQLLHISNTRLGWEGIHIVNALEGTPCLLQLQLNECSLPSEVVTSCVDRVRVSLPELTHLNLDVNECTEDVWDAVIRLLHSGHSTLESLSIQHTGTSLQKPHLLQFMQGLPHCTSLTHLNCNRLQEWRNNTVPIFELNLLMEEDAIAQGRSSVYQLLRTGILTKTLADEIVEFLPVMSSMVAKGHPSFPHADIFSLIQNSPEWKVYVGFGIGTFFPSYDAVKGICGQNITLPPQWVWRYLSSSQICADSQSFIPINTIPLSQINRTIPAATNSRDTDGNEEELSDLLAQYRYVPTLTDMCCAVLRRAINESESELVHTIHSLPFRNHPSLLSRFLFGLTLKFD
eukprot:m.155446 g.155446  ORF g.155446 m.155446 type:complete len:598 (-) comp13325_c0_seq36:2451-4244(-)